ncbi:Leucine-rich repeat-containing protein 7 [Rhizoctonia solani]|uniref:Leucine-rich repeat-containing protein 7 n=1 Tax=Rhizoctonia solani TaxID=456999 RepID=A0A0K6G583_9AGAM|nr:Leucine-rich repeat-containing protein 7 [Rhizoctonia solani]
MESDPYSANAKATQSPLLHTRTKRQTYTTPLTPSSSFTSYGPSSPSPTFHSNASTPIRVQSKYTPLKDRLWDEALNDVFHNGATIVNLDNSHITKIPREIIDLNKMVSLPLEPSESVNPPPVQTPTGPSRSTIASAAARSRRVFSQSRSSNSLFSSGSPIKPKREVQLYLANNGISILPSELFQLNNLTLLSLRGNKLRSLPPAIGNLKSLCSLNIASNELTSLPSELSFLNLQALLVHPNPFLPKPTTGSTQPAGSNDAGITQSRELGPLVTHILIPRLTEMALRAALRPSPDQPRLTPLSFITPSTQLSNTPASKSLLTPTDSQSSVTSFPSHAPPLSRSNSGPNPYNYDNFPPHTLTLEDHYDLTSWLSEKRDANVHVKAVRHGTEDACDLYSWCPGQRHRVDADTETSSSGIFVLPAEERVEWVSVLAGCELSPAVPILWRGCSAGCLSFLDGDTSTTSAPLKEHNEREKDDEFMSGFSGGNVVLNEGREAQARAQTHIIWDDMMDLDD